MMDIDIVLSILGLAVFAWRLQPWRRFAAPAPVGRPTTAVIVPCRNEEKNIGNLLRSLMSLRNPPSEIIVVDDGSTDATGEIVSGFAKVRMIQAPEKPEGWSGKSWACWIGARSTEAELLLFTDADTVHLPDSLSLATGFLQSERADLISAPPRHKCGNSFERALGLFHLLPLIATSYLAPVARARAFAIGQYFLARRSSYFECGGHHAIRDKLVDDIELARLFSGAGKKYAVLPTTGLYEVQMYSNLRAFLFGWIRLLRLGLRYTSIVGFIEVLLVLRLFAGTGSPYVFVPAIALLAWTQRQHGAFAVWGAILSPLSVFLFIALSSIGAVQALMRKKVIWHDRAYIGS